MHCWIALLAVVAPALAAPQYQAPYPSSPAPYRVSPVPYAAAPPAYRPAPRVAPSAEAHARILNLVDTVNYDGSYNYQYETENGIRAEAKGNLEAPGTPDEAITSQGSYSYTAPDGTPITVTWFADRNGFHAEGAHLPVAPPIPVEIARSLEYLRSLPPSKEDQQY